MEMARVFNLFILVMVSLQCKSRDSSPARHESVLPIDTKTTQDQKLRYKIWQRLFEFHSSLGETMNETEYEIMIWDQNNEWEDHLNAFSNLVFSIDKRRNKDWWGANYHITKKENSIYQVAATLQISIEKERAYADQNYNSYRDISAIGRVTEISFSDVFNKRIETVLPSDVSVHLHFKIPLPMQCVCEIKCTYVRNDWNFCPSPISDQVGIVLGQIANYKACKDQSENVRQSSPT